MDNESKARELLDTCLARVESASIREWARSPGNLPIWEKIALHAVENGKTDVHMFSAYIVATAIGL